MNKSNYKQFLSAFTNGDTVTPKIAEAFENLCSLTSSCYVESRDGDIANLGEYTILALYENIKFIYKIGLDFRTIKELEKLGLIKATMFGFKRTIDAEKYPISHFNYCSTVISVTGYRSNTLPLGNIMLTNKGKLISEFIDLHYYDEYIKILERFFAKGKLKVYEKPLIDIIENDGSGYEIINRDNQVFSTCDNLLRYQQSTYPKKNN